MMKRISLCVIGLVIAALAPADRIDDLMRRVMDADHIQGCSLAVLRNGKITKMKSYGETNIELHTKATDDTVYEIGSVSKQFEAAALMALSKAGKFDWDAPISKYVPNIPEKWAAITGRQLMSHTSGLPDYTDSKEHEEHHAEAVSHDEVISAIVDSPFAFAPGTKWSYCNTGSFLCGMAIENLTGGYDDFVRKQIFAPLGMTHTLLRTEEDVVEGRAQGYVWADKVMRPDFEDASWPFAGGGMMSTIKDMAIWERELYRQQQSNDSQVKEMWTPIQLQGSGSYPYGLGWQLADDRGFPNVWHTGHIPGFSAVISRFPEQGYTVILLTNEDNINTLRRARELAALYDPRLTPPDDLQPQADPDPELSKRIQNATTALAKNQPSDDYTKGLSAATTDQWRGQVAATLPLHPQFIYLGEDEIRSRNIQLLGSKISRIRHYTISFANVKITEGFYLTEDGKLAFVQDE